MDIVLRQAGIDRRDVEQFLHQINKTNQQGKKDQHPDHDRDDDPDRRDRRPASDIAALIEGRNIDQYDQRDDDERSQHYGQDDLPRELFAVFEIGCVNGFGECGFHVIYFSIFAPSVLCAPPPLLSELQFENGGGRVAAAEGA